tara:strand:- start:150 stop:479 length:330 start_codon:yes stop_codon:yes gene_type:complete
LAWLSYQSENWTKPRGELIAKDHKYRELPAVKLTPYIITYAFELGLCKSGGMGAVKIDWVDIAAWATLTDTQISADDAKLLMIASKSYVFWQSKVKEDTSPAPFQDDQD